MEEIDVFQKLGAIDTVSQVEDSFGWDTEKARRIAAHKTWMQSIRHERPSTTHSYNVAVYIRFFNQTKYTNYLSYHKKQFQDAIALCPKWNLVGFYVDNGASPPYMENAPEWGHLLDDCMNGIVDLIITQKVSNVSRMPEEVTLCARMLAAQVNPIGRYFLSEDIFTLASYYMGDLRDIEFIPDENQKKIINSVEIDRISND